MKNGLEACSDTASLVRSSAVDRLRPKKRKPDKRRRTRPQLLTRDQLDGRTNAAKLFDHLVVDIENDLGGRSQLSTIARTLIEAYVGACITLHGLNTKLAMGETIDLSQHAQAVTAMVRVASRLGIQRRARDVTPSLDAYMRTKHEVAAE